MHKKKIVKLLAGVFIMSTISNYAVSAEIIKYNANSFKSYSNLVKEQKKNNSESVIYVNGIKIGKSISKNGITYLPIDKIVKAMGGKVTINDKKYNLTLFKKEIEIYRNNWSVCILKGGRYDTEITSLATETRNGAIVRNYDVVPIEKNNAFYIPVEFIERENGFDLHIEFKNEKIYIEKRISEEEKLEQLKQRQEKQKLEKEKEKEEIINKSSLQQDVVFENNIGTIEKIPSIEIVDSEYEYIVDLVHLNNNKVLVFTYKDKVYLYDLKTSKWELVKSPRTTSGKPNVVLKLQDGNVLVLGDDIEHCTIDGVVGNYIKTEIFDVNKNKFISFKPIDTNQPGAYTPSGTYSAFQKDNGNIVLTGRWIYPTRTSGEIFKEYDMSRKKWVDKKRLRSGNQWIKNNEGNALCYGGGTLYYEANTEKFYQANNGNVGVDSSKKCKLIDGKFINIANDGVEIFDSENNNWKTVASIPNGKEMVITKTFLLNDSRILVIGGVRKEGKLNSHIYLYNPSTDKWIQSMDLKNSYDDINAIQLTDTNILVTGIKKGDKNIILGEKILINPKIKSVSKKDFSTLDTSVVFKIDSPYVVINGERHTIDNQKLKTKKIDNKVMIPSNFVNTYLKKSWKEKYISADELARLMNKKITKINNSDLISFSNKTIYTEKNTVDKYITLLDWKYKFGLFNENKIEAEKTLFSKDGWRYVEYKRLYRQLNDENEYESVVCRINDKEQIFEYIFTVPYFTLLKQEDDKIYFLDLGVLNKYTAGNKYCELIYYPFKEKLDEGYDKDNLPDYNQLAHRYSYTNSNVNESIKIKNMLRIDGDYVYTIAPTSMNDYLYESVHTGYPMRFKYDGSEAILLGNKKAGYLYIYMDICKKYLFFNTWISGGADYDFEYHQKYELRRVNKDGSDIQGIKIANIKGKAQYHKNKIYFKNVDDIILNDPIIVSNEYDPQYKWYVSDLEGNKKLFVDGTYTPVHYDQDYILVSKTKIDYYVELTDFSTDKTQINYYVYNLNDESVKKLDIQNRNVHIDEYGKDYLIYYTTKYVKKAKQDNEYETLYDVVNTGKYKINLLTGEKQELPLEDKE